MLSTRDNIFTGTILNRFVVFETAFRLFMPVVFFHSSWILYRLCGLVVRVLGYRSGGPGSIPDTTRKKKVVGSGMGSTQPREYNWGATWLNSSGSCLENREYGRRDPSRWPCGTLYLQKLAITSPTSGGHSVYFTRGLRPWSLFVFCLLDSVLPVVRLL
jgi:hypothetical protein